MTLCYFPTDHPNDIDPSQYAFTKKGISQGIHTIVDIVSNLSSVISEFKAININSVEDLDDFYAFFNMSYPNDANYTDVGYLLWYKYDKLRFCLIHAAVYLIPVCLGDLV